MLKKLKKIYYLFTIPVVVLFFVYGITKELYPSFYVIEIPPGIQPVLFIVASVTALAGPVFLRTFFSNKVKAHKSIDGKVFYRFQRNILLLSLVTPYLALIAMVFEFVQFYSAFIIIFSLYSLYYYFPSERRINFDKKIFRVK